MKKLIVTSAMLVAIGTSALYAEASERLKRLNIPAQPVGSALNEFAAQSGLQVVFYSELGKGITTKGLAGEFSSEADALKQLLADTGLKYEYINERTVAIKLIGDNGGKSKLASNNSLVAQAGTPAEGNGAGAGLSWQDQSGGRGHILEEIVVTAQKREQNLQDIPVAVSALTSRDIEKQGIENFEDFARQLPGVNLVQPSQNRAQFVIRGITTGYVDTGSRSQDEVATYINDISVTSSYFAFVVPDLRLFDVERVEVLRGPQGTLFGSGSLGGAVRVITNEPDASTFDSSVMLDAGQTKGGATLSRYSGMVNIPLVEDTLAIRAVGYYRNEEGYIDNIGTGKENANSTLDKGGRIAIQWTPTDRLTAGFTVLAQDSEPEDGDQIDPSLGDYKRNVASPKNIISELRIYSATVEYDLGFATLTSSTTVSKSLGDSFDGLNFLTDLIFNTGQDSTFTAEEIKLVSQTDGPFEWVVGGYYFDQEADQWDFIDVKDPQAFAQQFGVTGISANGRISSILMKLEAQEKAVFGEASYHLNERFTLTGGLRYSKSNMRFTDISGLSKIGGFVTAALNGGGDIDDVPPRIFDSDEKADSSVLTGKASISYQPDDNQTYYLLASRGYRVGQVNGASGPDPIDPVNGLNIPRQFEPDHLWNYEFGAKTTWLDGRLLANLALFYIPWENIQIAGTRLTDFTTFTGNAGKAISKGIELETRFLPTEQLQLGLNVTLQDAKITDISLQDSAVTGVLEGDKLPNSPDFQASGFAEYNWEVGNGLSMFARLDIQHVDSAINGFSNQAGVPGAPNPGLEESDAYENVNASMGLDNDQWRLTFYVENLTDNDEFTYISPTVFTDNKYSVLRPRTLGIRLNYSY